MGVYMYPIGSQNFPSSKVERLFKNVQEKEFGWTMVLAEKSFAREFYLLHKGLSPCLDWRTLDSNSVLH